MKTPTAADQLDEFMRRHAHLVTTALQSYIGDQGKTAAELEAAYAALVADPEAAAAQDQTHVTTLGVKLTANRIRESIGIAERALEAFTALQDRVEDGRV